MSEHDDYLRQLAECALARQTGPATAADIAEAMLLIAEDAGHPRPAYRGISAAKVAQGMRKLAGRKHAIAGEPRKNSRAGRDDPTWLPTAATRREVPLPPASLPDSAPAAAPPAADPAPLVLTPPEPVEPCPYDAYTRDELIEICKAQDKALTVFGELERQKDIAQRAVVRRLRADLQKAGLA